MNASARPVITLLTDFGLADSFVGVMKGVICQRCPNAQIIDLTHAIDSQDVQQAGYVLADSWRFFPPGTVHTAVVDPAVGSDRRIIAVRVGSQVLLAPDNGLLSAILLEHEVDEIRQVNNGAIFLKSISRTFHGRDVFAPCAGSLAAGMPFQDVGPPMDDPLLLDLPRPTDDQAGSIEGQVVLIDRFGNLMTNIPGTMLSLRPIISIGGKRIEGLSHNYGEVGEGHILAIIGSHGRLEIAVNGDSAAQMLNLRRGAKVQIESGLPKLD